MKERDCHKRNRPIMDDMLAAHGLTGCDTVATYHGIEKSVPPKVLRFGILSLSKVDDLIISVEEVIMQATPFMSSCHGHPYCSSLTDARPKIWSRNVLRHIGAALSFRVCNLQLKLSWKT